MNEDYYNEPAKGSSESFGPITPLMIEHLRSTKPWVRFISVMLFISVGLIFVAALGLLLIGAGMPGMAGGGLNVGIAIMYIMLGILYVFPAYFLHRYASAIRDIEQGGGDVAMEAALGSQKSFWKFVGILTLVVIGLYAIMLVVMILGVMSLPR